MDDVEVVEEQVAEEEPQSMEEVVETAEEHLERLWP